MDGHPPVTIHARRFRKLFRRAREAAGFTSPENVTMIRRAPALALMPNWRQVIESNLAITFLFMSMTLRVSGPIVQFVLEDPQPSISGWSCTFEFDGQMWMSNHIFQDVNHHYFAWIHVRPCWQVAASLLYSHCQCWHVVTIKYIAIHWGWRIRQETEAFSRWIDHFCCYKYFVLQVLRRYLLIDNSNIPGFVPCIARVTASKLLL